MPPGAVYGGGLARRLHGIAPAFLPVAGFAYPVGRTVLGAPLLTGLVAGCWYEPNRMLCGLATGCWYAPHRRGRRPRRPLRRTTNDATNGAPHPVRHCFADLQPPPVTFPTVGGGVLDAPSAGLRTTCRTADIHTRITRNPPVANPYTPRVQTRSNPAAAPVTSAAGGVFTRYPPYDTS